MKNKIKTILLILLAIALCFADNLFSQSFIGVSGSNKGVNLQIGRMVRNIEFKASYQQGIKQYGNIFSSQVGYEIPLTKDESDNYSIIPSFGVAYYQIKDFSQYVKTGEINNKEGIKPVLGIEVGKDLYKGRYFISGNYCNVFYYNVGIKAYIL